MLWRALRLSCPNCGARPIFARFGVLASRCGRCGLRPERGEGDYFIGAYLINLIAVELLLALCVLVVVVSTWPSPPWTVLMWVSAVLMLGGAVACYPFAKTLFLAVDLIIRPLSPEEMAWHWDDGAPGERVLPDR
ncbi:MAG: DUF983 domain-containing protein [Gemmatimonadaceae bacterium]|jgi:uncharacterized protein (DUF983 family)|nr:DUF983 domain-containing protein [Gemmatimonadaceae bacterium]